LKKIGTGIVKVAKNPIVQKVATTAALAALAEEQQLQELHLTDAQMLKIVAEADANDAHLHAWFDGVTKVVATADANEAGPYAADVPASAVAAADAAGARLHAWYD
jgi:hypothetical protein